MRSTIMTAISVVLFDLLQHKVREISLSKQIYSHIISGSSRKWSDSTWTHRKQLEQLLQQVTTLSVSHGITRASSVLRRHRALLLVVKVVFVVFPNSEGLFGTA